MQVLRVVDALDGCSNKSGNEQRTLVRVVGGPVAAAGGPFAAAGGPFAAAGGPFAAVSAEEVSAGADGAAEPSGDAASAAGAAGDVGWGVAAWGAFWEDGGACILMSALKQCHSSPIPKQYKGSREIGPVISSLLW